MHSGFGGQGRSQTEPNVGTFNNPSRHTGNNESRVEKGFLGGLSESFGFALERVSNTVTGGANAGRSPSRLDGSHTGLLAGAGAEGSSSTENGSLIGMGKSLIGKGGEYSTHNILNNGQCASNYNPYTDLEDDKLECGGDFYKYVADQCQDLDIVIDTFLCPPTYNAYVDVTTQGHPCAKSGGELYYYHGYNTMEHAEQLHYDISRTVLRPSAFGCNFKIRTGRGLHVEQMYAPFEPKSS